MKIGIVGAGFVGATAAYALALPPDEEEALASSAGVVREAIARIESGA